MLAQAFCSSKVLGLVGDSEESAPASPIVDHRFYHPDWSGPWQCKEGPWCLRRINTMVSGCSGASLVWRDPQGPWGAERCVLGSWLEARAGGEIRISKARKWASLAKIVGHEALIHSLESCQSGICKMENQLWLPVWDQPVFGGCAEWPETWAVPSCFPLAGRVSQQMLLKLLLRMWAL